MTTSNADRWLFKLRELQMALDHMILCTPTGKVRNLLCDANILLNVASAEDNPCKQLEKKQDNQGARA